MSSVAQKVRRKRNRQVRKQQAQTYSRLWTSLIVLALLTLILLPLTTVSGVLAFLYFRSISNMPGPAETTYLDPIVGASLLLDRDEQTVLYSVEDPLGNDRRWVYLENLPAYVVDATLLMEDPNFLEVSHFNSVRTISQLWSYVLGVPLSPNQTITGRLVRNAILPRANREQLDPLLMDIVLSAETNRRYDAETILEWHLNTNYYGNDAYGIDAAAEVYFGKSATELSLNEAAMLAAIPPAPHFNPLDNETAARGRQADLLRNMLAAGLIDEPTFQTAVSSPTQLNFNLAQSPFMAPDFSLYARQQAENILDSLGLDGSRLVSRSGLKIITTLDLDLYQQAECVLRAQFASLSGLQQNTQTQTGMPCLTAQYLDSLVNADPSSLPDVGQITLIDPSTGEILALVGDADDISYQPSAVLYPIVYLEGFLSADYTPASMVMDIPQTFPGVTEGLIYTPNNVDKQFRGVLNLRDAMVAQLLPPVVSIADSRGLSRVIKTAHRLGFNSLDTTRNDLSILEYGGDVSVLDAAYAYSVFANMGAMRGIDVQPIGAGFRARDPVAVLRIEDAEGNILWEYDEDAQALSQTPILVPSLAYLINDILSDETSRRAMWANDDLKLKIGRPAASLQTLSHDHRDNWTIGYTPQLVGAVHLNRLDAEPMSLDTYGTQGSAPIWQALMRYYHDRENLAALNWQRPDDIVEYVVCEKSGFIPASSNPCPTRTEYFIRNIPPFKTDTLWQRYEINSQTGQLATANTPAFLREELIYFVPPPEAMDWWVSNGQPLPPSEYDTLSRPDVLKSVRLLQPADFAYVGGQVDIRATMDTNNMRYYQLSYGANIDPKEWFEIGEQQTEFIEGTSLGIWDTSALDGVYTLRLTVVFEDNSIDSDIVLTTVDNIPPSVTLTTLDGQTTYRWPTTTQISIEADVSDNLTIDRVEFYLNGQLLGSDKEWPFALDYDLQGIGENTFTAVAFDQVGNSSTAELLIEVFRSAN